ALSTGLVRVMVADSVVAGNGSTGVRSQSLSGAVTEVMVRDCTVADNAEGVSAIGNATLRTARSTITGNGTAWNFTGGGVLPTYQDNSVADNVAPGSGPSGSIGFY